MGRWQGSVEDLVMYHFSNIYQSRRVLVTGHTGFKGSWLSLWLDTLGAKVTGVSLFPETQPNHWGLLNLDINDHRQDIRDAAALRAIVQNARPEIVFHLAAQPLVRHSYREPLLTWETNVMGTVNLLEACRNVPGIKAIVVITTDKCYENREWMWGYREIDRLGGRDPYSASKAGAELVAASYRSAFFNMPNSPLLATARAGNVIGGGDWSMDRLIPDLVRAVSAGQPLEIRSPKATRPWQHVLECLAGYLLLGQRLLEGGKEYAEAWNFGPDHLGNRMVSEVIAVLEKHWPSITWRVSTAHQPHESTLLYLDSVKARERLGWVPVWGLEEALAMTAAWYRYYLKEGKVLSRLQLAAYSQRLVELMGQPPCP